MSMKEKLFALVGFSAQRHSLKTEVVSGLTTFITMSYILALLPAMFAPLGSRGFPINSLFTAIALATVVGTLLMAFLAKRPFGQAPGLTLNVFFIETICSASHSAILGSLRLLLFFWKACFLCSSV